ncbi:MAG: hypothetical protein ABIP17_03035 [Ilumatobacteraceae bacterium]
MTIVDDALASAWRGRRARLCEAMLERNLHQLHRAADDLRATALRLRERADGLDADVGSAA